MCNVNIGYCLSIVIFCTTEGPLSYNDNTSSWDPVESTTKDISLGGKWKPRDCHARSRVAVIIAYKKEEEYLLQRLLDQLHSVLQRQLLEYQIFTVQQVTLH